MILSDFNIRDSNKINSLDWSKMSKKKISDNDITTKDNTNNNINL